MKTLLIRFLTLVGGILLTSYLLPGIEVEGASAALAAALVLGVLNLLLKPLLRLVSVPLNLLTFGLFRLVINGFILWTTGVLVEGFLIIDFLSALAGAVIISILGILVQELIH